MESFSEIALILLGIIVFIRFRDGTAGDWIKAKFFNSAMPGTPKIRWRAAGDVVGGAVAGAGAGNVVGSTGWMAPAPGPVVSGFGPRKSPGGIGSTNHKGLDIDGRTGDPISASKSGRVIFAGNAGGYGLKVDVDHGGGWVTRYGHMSKILVRVGQQVRAGETLGLMGATGTATGDHLHFEIRRNGVAVDPAPYLAGAGGGNVAAPTRSVA